jgi:hypothetical protein
MTNREWTDALLERIALALEKQVEQSAEIVTLQREANERARTFAYPAEYAELFIKAGVKRVERELSDDTWWENWKRKQDEKRKTEGGSNG